jgi:hypothetical protein
LREDCKSLESGAHVKENSSKAFVVVSLLVRRHDFSPLVGDDAQFYGVQYLCMSISEEYNCAGEFPMRTSYFSERATYRILRRDTHRQKRPRVVK